MVRPVPLREVRRVTRAGQDGPATSATRPARNFLSMKHRSPWFTLALAALAIATHFSPAATAALEFTREAIARGEWWRFATAHLTHFDANHLWWDVAVFVVVGGLCERESRARFACGLVTASIAITLAVWTWQPQFASYRGLSGLDCALFGVFASDLLQHRERAVKFVGALGLAGVAAKCGAELATGSTLFATGGSYVPVPLAHLVGAAAGWLTAWWAARWPVQATSELTFRRQKSYSPDPRLCR